MVKNFTVIVFFLVLGIGFSFAQVPAQESETFIMAKEQTLNMQANVRFNEFEYIRILKLTEQRILDIKELYDSYNEDGDLLAGSIRLINHDFDQAVLKLLNNRQQKAYRKYKVSTDYIAYFKKE